MKNTLFSILFCTLWLSGSSQTLTGLHHYKAVTIDGDTIKLSNYYGKRLMLVNTASYCGYTPQFALLQQLYKIFKEYDFEILGFPSNDFGSQDPYNDSIIHYFCTSNYGVTFQMMGKINIIQGDTSPVYKWLQRKSMNGKMDINVDWNFNKFLVDETGHWVAHYPSPVSPFDTAITNWILKPSLFAGIRKYDERNNPVEIRWGNPAGSSIDLLFRNAPPLPCSVELYSIQGKFIGNILNKTLSVPERLSYNVSDLEAGLYFIKIRIGESEWTRRVVIL